MLAVLGRPPEAGDLRLPGRVLAAGAGRGRSGQAASLRLCKASLGNRAGSPVRRRAGDCCNRRCCCCRSMILELLEEGLGEFDEGLVLERAQPEQPDREELGG